MSGLCLSAFVLALVLALAAFLSLWPGVLLPLALSIVALFTVDTAKRRGRAFAWWALGISLGSGVWGYVLSAGTHALVDQVSNGVLAALRAAGTDADRDRLLDDWIVADAPAGARERIRAQHAEALRRAGPIRGAAVPATVWAGMFPHFLPPQGVKPIDGGDAKDHAPGMALWVRVPFERGEVHMALVIGEDDPKKVQASLESVKQDRGFTGPVRILRDLRFYADPKVVPPEPPTAPATGEGR
jgi:hypothetical protein